MADPLVLLHGFTGRGKSWDSVLQELMSCDLQRPVDGWSPDLPGHGSSGEARPDSFEATVEELADRIRERFDEPILLVGYSLGGRLALGISVRHPDLIRELILVGTQPGLDTVEERRERAGRDAQLAERIVSEGVVGFINYWQSLPLFDSQKQVPTPRLVRQSEIRKSHDAEGLAWAVRTLSPGLMPNYRPALLSWSGCPITWVSGALDEKFTEVARQSAVLSDQFEHCLLEGVGHNALLEDPSAVARIISERLCRHQGGTPR